MNFMDRLKGQEDIIALCESFSMDRNASFGANKVTPEAVEGDKGGDVFNPDDLFSTVDLPEDEPAASGPSFSADDIELTHEQKEDVKKALTSILDEIKDKDSISEPALEMIVNEVANRTSYLSEAEEANLEGPVEKEKYRVGLIDSIKKFINELLGVTAENDGVIPDNVDDLGGEGAGAGEPDGDEGAGEGAGDNDGDEGAAGAGAGEPDGDEGAGAGAGDNDGDEGKNALQEGAFDGSDAGSGESDGQGEPEGSVQQEGVCTECDGGAGEGVVEVDPSDLIQVLDDNDPNVTPIDGAGVPAVPGAEEIPGAAGAPVGGDLGLADDTPLTVGTLKEFIGKLLTESVEGEKSFAELWKNLAGNAITLAKPNTKGEQKTADPKGKAPEGTSYTTTTDESGNANTLAKPNTKGEQKTADPKGKAPEGTSYQTPAAPKGGEAGGHVKKPEMSKEEAAKLAAVLHEGKDASALLFLQEASAAITKARASLNS